MLRTPTLPVEDLLKWGEGLRAADVLHRDEQHVEFEDAWSTDVSELRKRLVRTIQRPEVGHALFIASPSLHASIDHWIAAPTSKKGHQTERAIVRYFERMCTRATPFGIFAGCSLGYIASNSSAVPNLKLGPRASYQVHTRLDFNYLLSLTAALRSNESLSRHLTYWPNSSLHRSGNYWHFVETCTKDNDITHHLVRVETDQHLEAVLARAANGATVDQFAETLMSQNDPDLHRAEVEEYVLALIENQVLIASLFPLVTGESVIGDLIHQLEGIPGGQSIAGKLSDVRDKLSALDMKGLGVKVEEYSSITSIIETLPSALTVEQFYQTDMLKPVNDAILTPAITDEIVKAAHILNRLNAQDESRELLAFRIAFEDRYGTSMVPLLEVLDQDAGIGFGERPVDDSPLLQAMGPWQSESYSAPLHPAHAFLLKKLIGCLHDGNQYLELEDDLSHYPEAVRNLPNTFCMNAEIITL
jgi:hypothetical protein